VNSGLNLNSQGALAGVNGPFFANANIGGTLSFTFGGAASSPVLLLLGPLNRNNWVVPGVGSLDIGLLGPGNLTDVGIVLDGFSAPTFLDGLAGTGPTGSRTLSFTMPSMPAGILGAFQAAVQSPSGVALSAAFQLTVELSATRPGARVAPCAGRSA
jgi:hypothetical protein